MANGVHEVGKWYGTSIEIDPLKRRAEDHLKTVLDELGDGVIQLNDGMRILRANTRSDEIIGRAVTARRDTTDTVWLIVTRSDP